MKTCRKCQTQKNNNEFGSDKRNADQLRGECLACTAMREQVRRKNEKLKQNELFREMGELIIKISFDQTESPKEECQKIIAKIMNHKIFKF